MNQKKNTKILLIIIIVLFIVILFAGVAVAYLATDIFRSDKELFFKYITQIGDQEKGFINNDLNQYFEKRKSIAFNNQGEFSVNISDDENEDKYSNINNFKIEFSGQVDGENSRVAQNISINYSDSVSEQLKFKQVGSKFGLQTNDVGSKYIAIDVNDLNKLSQSNMTINDYSKTIKKLQDITKVEINKEELENIINTYKNLLNEELHSEWFSKVEDSNLVGYKLSLDGENLKNVLVKLLENIKNDQTVLDKINEYLKVLRNSNKITANNIDEFIEKIQDANGLEDKKIEIIVYKENNSVAKISIGVDDSFISLQKQSDKNSQSFRIEAKQKDKLIFSISMKFEGLQSIQNIKENYDLQYDVDNYSGYNSPDVNEDSYSINTSNKTTYKYNFKNDINFTYDSDIEDFTNDNSLILTNYDQESVSKFMSALIQRVQAINKRDMEKLGVNESENPIFQAIPSISISPLGLNQTTMTNNGMSELAINTFNNKFEVYQGTNLSPQTVKGLLTTISLNNENGEEYKIKEINFEGQEYEASEQNITFVKSDIDKEKNYRVEFEKDQDIGIIYRVIINAR